MLLKKESFPNKTFNEVPCTWKKCKKKSFQSFVHQEKQKQGVLSKLPCFTSTHLLAILPGTLFPAAYPYTAHTDLHCQKIGDCWQISDLKYTLLLGSLMVLLKRSCIS